MHLLFRWFIDHNNLQLFVQLILANRFQPFPEKNCSNPAIIHSEKILELPWCRHAFLPHGNIIKSIWGFDILKNLFSFSILGNYETLPVRSGFGNNMAIELNPAKEQNRIITFVMEDKV